MQGFSKGKSRPENQKVNMTHLTGLQLATRLSHVLCEVIQPNSGVKQFSHLAILNFSTQGEGELSKTRKVGRTHAQHQFDLNDIKKDEDVRREIVGYFESTLVDQGKGNW